MDDYRHNDIEIPPVFIHANELAVLQELISLAEKREEPGVWRLRRLHHVFNDAHNLMQEQLRAINKTRNFAQKQASGAYRELGAE